jgi:hypothetical protein
MIKSNQAIIFLIILLLSISLIIFALVKGEIGFSEIAKRQLPADPNGHLTVDIELGMINIELTDESVVDIYIREEWKSRWLIFQPKPTKWIKEMLKDLEFTIIKEPPNIRIEGKFKRGREHWQDGLEWLTVNIDLKVPRGYKVVNATSK